MRKSALADDRNGVVFEETRGVVDPSFSTRWVSNCGRTSDDGETMMVIILVEMFIEIGLLFCRRLLRCRIVAALFHW